MIIRKNILPRTYLDMFCTGALFGVFIPYIYWYEMFEVLPHYYQIGTSWYMVHWICGSFVAFQAVSNLVAIILCDTSLRGRTMSTTLLPGWRFCSACETTAPPRSWHCDVCNTCILRRDHHCLFTGCCIGLENYRYFFIFIFYTCIALIYSFYFNSAYTWEVVDMTQVSWINVVFPLAMVIYDFTPQQLNLLVFLLLTIAMGLCFMILYLHITLIKDNQVMHERGENITVYNIGAYENVRGLFGKKWYMCFLSAFAKSELTFDGINWKTNENIDTPKTK